MIETRHLTKTFDKLTAVENLTFTVNSGEIFAFLGPNGAGKTTTMRMLACLIGPSSGEATVAGLQVLDANGNGVGDFVELSQQVTIK